MRKTTQGKREFLGAFSVRIGTSRARFEIADGEPYGSAPGLYRVRLGRRWLDGFYSRAGLARLVVDAALDGLPGTPDAMPSPVTGAVSVWFDRDGEMVRERGFALSPWVRTFGGEWQIMVRTPSYKGFVAAADVVREQAPQGIGRGLPAGDVQ